MEKMDIEISQNEKTKTMNKFLKILPWMLLVASLFLLVGCRLYKPDVDKQIPATLDIKSQEIEKSTNKADDYLNDPEYWKNQPNEAIIGRLVELGRIAESSADDYFDANQEERFAHVNPEAEQIADSPELGEQVITFNESYTNRRVVPDYLAILDADRTKVLSYITKDQWPESGPLVYRGEVMTDVYFEWSVDGLFFQTLNSLGQGSSGHRFTVSTPKRKLLLELQNESYRKPDVNVYHGYVTDRYGDPLPGTKVGFNVEGHSFFTTTDANGHYVLEAKPVMEVFSDGDNDYLLTVYFQPDFSGYEVDPSFELSDSSQWGEAYYDKHGSGPYNENHILQPKDGYDKSEWYVLYQFADPPKYLPPDPDYGISYKIGAQLCAPAYEDTKGPLFITVGFNCTGGASCNDAEEVELEEYIRLVLQQEWNGNGWSPSTVPGINIPPTVVEAFRAGATAVRSFANYHRDHPNAWNSSPRFHICRSQYCQDYKPSNGPTQEISSAVAYNKEWMLVDNSDGPAKSEFSAENNDYSGDQVKTACESGLYSGICAEASNGVPTDNDRIGFKFGIHGDGYFRASNDADAGAGYPRFPLGGNPDYVSLGRSDADNSHPRGMSQRGSFRWATGLDVNSGTAGVTGNKIGLPILPGPNGEQTKSWVEILSHYYPYYSLESCSGKVIDLGCIDINCDDLSAPNCGCSPDPNVYIPIDCGQWVITDVATDGVYNTSHYGCENWHDYGKEVVYSFSHDGLSDIVVYGQNVSPKFDVDVFIIHDANSDGYFDQISECSGDTKTGDEFAIDGVLASYVNAPVGNYLVVVETGTGHLESGICEIKVEASCSQCPNVQASNPLSISAIPTSVPFNGTTQLQASFTGNVQSYNWYNESKLSCTTCPSPNLTMDETPYGVYSGDLFSVQVVDDQSQIHDAAIAVNLAYSGQPDIGFVPGAVVNVGTFPSAATFKSLVIPVVNNSTDDAPVGVNGMWIITTGPDLSNIVDTLAWCSRDRIPAGAQRNLQFGWYKNQSHVATGTYYMHVLIDPQDELAETDETNNHWMYPNPVLIINPNSANSRPDYVVTNVSGVPNIPEIGQKYSVDIDITNQGLGTSPLQLDVMIYFSENNQLGHHDVPLLESMLTIPSASSILSTQTVTLTTDLLIPYNLPSNGYIIVVVDPPWYWPTWGNGYHKEGHGGEVNNHHVMPVSFGVSSSGGVQSNILAVNPGVVCKSDPVNFQAFECDPTWTYSWDFGDGNMATGTTVTHQYVADGTYTVILSVNDGTIVETDQVDVVVSGHNLDATATKVSDATCPQTPDGSATLTASATGNYQYQWDNGESTATAVNLDPGIHYGTIIDPVGCNASASVVIGTSSLLALDFEILKAPSCDAPNGKVKAIVTGKNGSVSYTWLDENNDPYLDLSPNKKRGLNMSPGLYTVVAADNTCPITRSIVLEAVPDLFPTIVEANDVCTANNPKLKIDFSAGNGNKPYQNIIWFADGIEVIGATGKKLAGVVPGVIYQVKIVDEDGCDATSPSYSFTCSGTSNRIANPSLSSGVKKPWIKMYPNPVHDDLTLQYLRTHPAHLKLQLMNLHGQIVSEVDWQPTTLGQKQLFNVINQPEGIFFLQILDANNGSVHEVRRVVVIH